MEHRISRTILIVAILTCLYVASLAIMDSATGYEYSIVRATPTIVWLLFAALLIAAISILSIAAIDTNSTLGIVGFLAAAVAYTGYYALPSLRGWEHHSGFGNDGFVHLGIVQDILETGVITNATYPGTHSLFTAFTYITGMPVADLTWLLSLYFFLTFIIGIGFVSSSMTNDMRITLLSVLIAIPLYFGSQRVVVMPWLYAFTYLTFSLAAIKMYLVRNRRRWMYFYVISMLALMFVHPFTMLFGLLATGSYALYTYRNVSIQREPTIASLPVIILTVSFVGWHFTQGTLGSRSASLLSTIFGVSGNPGGAVQLSEQTGTADYTAQQLIFHFFIPNWGVMAFLFTIAGLTTITVLYHWPRNVPNVQFAHFISLHYILAGLIGVGMLLVEIHGPNVRRNTQYLIFISIFAAALGVYYLLERFENPEQRRIIAVTVIVLVCGPLVLYDAANTYGTNDQVSTASVQGWEWQLDNRPFSAPLIADTGRDVYAYYYFGNQRTTELVRSGAHVSSHTDLPDRLGYNSHATVADSIEYPGSVFMATRSGDREWWKYEPEWRHEDLTYHTTEDHERLHQDATATHVYDNGEMDIWVVHAGGEQD